MDESTTGLDAFHEGATKAYNGFRDKVHAAKGPVLRDLPQNNQPTKPVLKNPYKEIVYYKDNRHTFVPERDIRGPYDGPHPPPMPGWEKISKPRKPGVIITTQPDKLLGNIGEAEINFGNGIINKPKKTTEPAKPDP